MACVMGGLREETLNIHQPTAVRETGINPSVRRCVRLGNKLTLKCSQAHLREKGPKGNSCTARYGTQWVCVHTRCGKPAASKSVERGSEQWAL